MSNSKRILIEHFSHETYVVRRYDGLQDPCAECSVRNQAAVTEHFLTKGGDTRRIDPMVEIAVYEHDDRSVVTRLLRQIRRVNKYVRTK